ncbi:unnamed protein product [Allacma fusca]|uniref:Glycine-rich protein n=1 Tax=Allacma fusca TaxID=39272 RepID=A0A8J2LQA9_9HEXA|nr:unnamed protein product [Allacma fusca]
MKFLKYAIVILVLLAMALAHPATEAEQLKSRSSIKKNKPKLVRTRRQFFGGYPGGGGGLSSATAFAGASSGGGGYPGFGYPGGYSNSFANANAVSSSFGR